VGGGGGGLGGRLSEPFRWVLGIKFRDVWVYLEFMMESSWV